MTATITITGKTYAVEGTSVVATVSLHPERINVVRDEASCPATVVLSISSDEISEASPIPALFSLYGFCDVVIWDLLSKEEGEFLVDPYESIDVYGVDISLAAESAISSACVKAEGIARDFLRKALESRKAA